MPQFLPVALLFVLAQTPSLDSVSPRERLDAIEAMAVLGNRDAVPSLSEAYGNEASSEIRTAIVRAFGRIRDRSAIPSLTEALLSDLRQDVRLQAIDSLLRLHIPVADERGFRSFIRDVTGVFRDDPQLFVGDNEIVDPATQEALLESLETDFDLEVRIAAANALGSLRATDQLAALTEALDSPRHREDWQVQVAVIRTMGSIGSPDAGPVLTRFIRDRDERVAREAIQAIGRTGYQAAFPALSNLFRTADDRRIRDLALEAITMLRVSDAVGLFESIIDSEDDFHRELAARGLGRLDYDASGFAERIVTEGDASVRLAQAYALAASGNSSYLPMLVEALDTRRAEAAEIYLVELGRYEGKLPELYPHLRNPNADIRARLVRVVGWIGMTEARPYIQPLTQDRDDDVAEAAVEALRNLTR